MGYFFALDIPDEIAEDLKALELEGANIRTQRRSDMHITLSYMGNVPEDKLDILIQEAAKIQCDPFSLQVDGVFYFPPNQGYRGHFYGASIEKNDKICELKSKVDEKIKGLGLKNMREKEDYSPHITLFRSESDESREETDEFLQKYADFTTSPFFINSFALYRSDHPNPYEKIEEFNFKT